MVDIADEYVFVNAKSLSRVTATGWIAKLSNVMRYIPLTIANHECKESKSKLQTCAHLTVEWSLQVRRRRIAAIRASFSNPPAH